MPTIDYRLKDGKRVGGVTTIISSNLGWNGRALMYWAWNEGREGRDYKATAQKAADSGTIAHAMIEAELKGKEYKIPDVEKSIIEKAETAYLAWLEWKDLVQFQLIESEKSLVSEVYGYGGTIDIASIKKVPAIVDLKTSNGVYPDHKLQVSAYGQLWNENFPEQKIQAYYILQLGKEDGSFHYHYWPSLQNEFTAFLCCLSLHNLKKFIK